MARNIQPGPAESVLRPALHERHRENASQAGAPVCSPAALSGGEGCVIHLVHLQVVVEYLKHFLDVWDITRLKLRPQRNIIQCDLKGACGQEVSLHHVTEEEGHEAREDLVVLTPGPGQRGVEAKEEEGVLTTDDQQDGEKLQV